MINVTKKEVRDFVKEFKDGTPFDWKINNCCVLVRENKIEFVIDYVGQGMSELLYNGDYDKKIDIKNLIESYKGISGSNNIEETTEFIFERINNELN